MSEQWRRYEVLLPVRYNDGREVPARLTDAAFSEVVKRFGGAIDEGQEIEGKWMHGGRVYRDDLVRIVVDVPETEENREWMRDYKRRWRLALEQLEIWMTSYSIELE